MLGGLAAVYQASVLDGLSFDPFSFQQDGLSAPEVDVGRGEVGDGLVVSQVVVVGDEGADLGLEIAGQIVVLQQDAVHERLVPTLDLALGLGMEGGSVQTLSHFGRWCAPVKRSRRYGARAVSCPDTVWSTTG